MDDTIYCNGILYAIILIEMAIFIITGKVFILETLVVLCMLKIADVRNEFHLLLMYMYMYSKSGLKKSWKRRKFLISFQQYFK